MSAAQTEEDVEQPLTLKSSAQTSAVCELPCGYRMRPRELRRNWQSPPERSGGLSHGAREMGKRCGERSMTAKPKDGPSRSETRPPQISTLDFPARTPFCVTTTSSPYLWSTSQPSEYGGSVSADVPHTSCVHCWRMRLKSTAHAFNSLTLRAHKLHCTPQRAQRHRHGSPHCTLFWPPPAACAACSLYHRSGRAYSLASSPPSSSSWSSSSIIATACSPSPSTATYPSTTRA